MTQLFQNILTASFHGSIIITAVILLRLVLKRTPKKFLCFLWLLAGIRLLMPFEIQSDLSLQPEPEPLMAQIAEYEFALFPPEYASSHLPPETDPVMEALPPEPSSVITPSPTEVLSPVETVTLHAPSLSPGIDWESLIPYIWLTVASFFLIYTIYAYVRLRLLVRESIRIEGGWECDRIETAFILGFIRPRIYIPMGLSKMVRKHILAHERTHLEKGDHWFKMVGFIALALHWFNPLVWVAYTLLCKDIEMACDERVVQFMELQERKEYSAALLNCSTNRAHFAACPVAFGEVSVKHRIKSVLSYKKPSFWISLLGVLAILFVALCFVTSPVDPEETPAVSGDTNAVRVSDVDELLSAIAPNTEIILEPGTYNLCKAKTYGKTSTSEYYTWEGNFDGAELVIRNVDNLHIRGSGRLSTTIETDPRWVNVLRAQNCTNLTMDGFTAGHTRDRGECSGGVVYLEGCNDVSMNDLGLFGCGVVGLTTELCADVTLTNSEIYECSSSAVNLSTTNNVALSGCRVYDIGLEEFGGYTFFEIYNCQKVTVDNCELSGSTLNSFLVSSGTEAILRNNLFVGNRVRNNAFTLNGQNIVLDSNKFDGNTIRSWYDSFGNVATDAQGQLLTEATLNTMYPAEPKQATQPQLEIHVANVDELIAAIGPNTKIILDSEWYELSEATGYGTSSGSYYYWEDMFDGPGLVIRDVDNMTIASADGNVKKHTISAVPRYADVLAFKACSNVTLSGFTAGHTIEPGSCIGGVIEFRDCDNMTVDNCGLYGCGILGVYAEYSKNIQVLNSDIYECSLGGIEMRDTDQITVSGNTFRDLGGDDTSFIGCTNINLDGQLLNPQTEIQQPIAVEPMEPVVDEEDVANLGQAVDDFAQALFRGDVESMKLYLAENYEYYDIPIEIPDNIIGAQLSASQEFPSDYANQMESKGYCTLTINYWQPVGDDKIQTNMLLEMCRENGAWKVQYYTLNDTETGMLDRDIFNFVWAYFEQDIENLKPFLADSYTGSIDVYMADAGKAEIVAYSVEETISNAELSQLNYYSLAFPFMEDSSSDTYSYLNIALQRRENKKTYTENGYTRTESEWVVLDYGIESAAPDTASSRYLPGGIQIDTIERENYNGVVMLIEDPSRVFLGTSTDGAFSTEIPGKRISEMFDIYPEAVAAVNAGAFFDDGTASTAVGSYPLGLTISNGETVWSQAMGISPGLEGFAGFNSKNELIVVNHNLSPEEAAALDIRDGVGMGPALIINREVQDAAQTNSGYTPRTAIGQREDGTVILMCINGRVFNSLGATYAEVANEMMAYGAESACLMQGGSATAMAYHPEDSEKEPELLTTISSLNADTELKPRRLPTYWMVSAK